MTSSQILMCASCGSPTLADDHFCEACGDTVDRAASSELGHTEIDLGGVAAVSDRGKRHSRNDDAWFASADPARSVAVVCDGVSSAAGARVAAEVAATVVGSAMVDGTDPADAVRSGFDAVAALPWSQAPHRTSPASTVVAASWDGRRVTVGWLGDSRAYWIDATAGHRLTHDHSWVEEHVAAGLADAGDPSLTGREHVITRWLGAGGLGAGPGHSTFEPTRPGIVVLCSDGLWHHVPDVDEIAAVAAAAEMRPITVATRLADLALDRGGHDNVTVVVLAVCPTTVGLDPPEVPS